MISATPATASSSDIGSIGLIIAAMIGCLLLLFALILIVGAQRMARQLLSGYARRREERFADIVLGALLEPQEMRSLKVAPRGLRRRELLGPRPFDTLILERMLLLQAVELRGSDRKTMTGIFEDCGLVERAVRQMRSLRWWRRLSGAQKLGVMRSARVVPALLRAAVDRESNVRIAALRSLGEINDERAYPLLLAAMEDRATSVRSVDIVLAIGPAISPYLLARFESLSDAGARTLYVRLLGLLQEPAALDILLPLAHGADIDLRLEVIIALGAIGDARAVSALQPLLGDPDRQTRAEAARALGRIGARTSVVGLGSLLADPSRSVRYSAACALVALGADGAAALEQAVQGVEPLPKGIAEQALAEQALGLI